MADDLHTLSAPYALDALTPDERERFEEHLESCERCRTELAGLSAAAASLAFAVEGPGPIAGAVALAASAAAIGLGIWAASLHHSLTQERSAVRVLGDPAARHVAVH